MYAYSSIHAVNICILLLIYIFSIFFYFMPQVIYKYYMLNFAIQNIKITLNKIPNDIY